MFPSTEPARSSTLRPWSLTREQGDKMSYVRVNLFGSPEIKVGDGAVHIGSRRAMALFAYLTQAEQAVSRDLGQSLLV